MTDIVVGSLFAQDSVFAQSFTRLGPTAVVGEMSVTNNATVVGDILAQANLLVSKDASVTGAAIMEDSLEVRGATSLQSASVGTLETLGSVFMGKNLEVNGDILQPATAKSNLGNVNVSGQMTVSDMADFTGLVGINVLHLSDLKFMLYGTLAYSASQVPFLATLPVSPTTLNVATVSSGESINSGSTDKITRVVNSGLEVSQGWYTFTVTVEVSKTTPDTFYLVFPMPNQSRVGTSTYYPGSGTCILSYTTTLSLDGALIAPFVSSTAGGDVTIHAYTMTAQYVSTV